MVTPRVRIFCPHFRADSEFCTAIAIELACGEELWAALWERALPHRFISVIPDCLVNEQRAICIARQNLHASITVKIASCKAGAHAVTAICRIFKHCDVAIAVISDCLINGNGRCRGIAREDFGDAVLVQVCNSSAP